MNTTVIPFRDVKTCCSFSRLCFIRYNPESSPEKYYEVECLELKHVYEIAPVSGYAVLLDNVLLSTSIQNSTDVLGISKSISCLPEYSKRSFFLTIIIISGLKVQNYMIENYMKHKKINENIICKVQHFKI